MQQRHSSLGFFAGLARLLSWLLSHWMLLAIAAFFISPIGPHMRWTYSYTGAYDHPTYLHCTYLGSRGVITPNLAPACPFITILDARRWQDG